MHVPAEGHVSHDIALATRSQLTGTVRSAGAGRPVAEALATLVSEDGHVVGSRVTGEDGSFRFDDVAHGVYTITASGYAPVASEIEIGLGQPSEVVLSLVPPAVDAPSGGRGAGESPSPRPDAPRGDDGAMAGYEAGHGSGNGAGRHVHPFDSDDATGTRSPSGERW